MLTSCGLNESVGRNLHHFTKGAYEIVLNTAFPLEQADVENIAGYLTQNYKGEFFLSETRSALIPCRTETTYDGIKIKGAGFEGGPVRFGTLHKYDYSVPYYDYEGNYSPDVAKDFHRAYAGGMTYQQTLQEFQVSSYLVAQNFETYPPLGYGLIKYNGLCSWFCLLNAPFRAPVDGDRLYDTEENIKTTTTFLAKSQKELYRLGVNLVLSGITAIDGKLIRKDFHTSVIASPNDSFMTRLCYFLFDVNFVLYLYVDPHRPVRNHPKTPKGCNLARIEYVRGLTDMDSSITEVDEFKKLLVVLKENHSLNVYERVEFLKRNSLTKKMLMQFMSEDEKAQFL